MPLVLASNSPRRRQLLALGGWTFTVLPVKVDENPLPGEVAKAYVLRLAQEKARVAAARLDSDAVVIAFDTTVVDAGEILGKPENAMQAEAMLRRLRGHRHQVYTGLAVLRTADRALLSDCCTTDVPMRDYSDEEMLAYIATGDPLDKAGAYAIQHPGFMPVASLSGCYANVVGLPLCHLVRTLQRININPVADVPQACQASLGYSCPVYRRVLEGEF